MADGSLPRFGDDVRSSARGAAYLMEYAYAATKDPDLLGLLPRTVSWDSVQFGRDVTKTGQPPTLTSRVFAGAGHAILRTEGKAGLTAAFTFGPYGGFHGHLDKLSFVFFGWGQELGVDPGRAASQAYRLPVHKRWYKSTISHNAVLVDTAPQRPAQGTLELFAANAKYAAVAARCDGAYPGVKQRRLLVMTPNYLLVLDRLAADKERRFDWVYHNRGIGAECDAATEAGGAPKSFIGMEYVQNTRAGATDGPVRVRFVGKAADTCLTMAPAPGTAVLTGDGVGASVLDRVPMAMVTRRGRDVDFAAVLEPLRPGSTPVVSEVALERQEDSVSVTVRRGDAHDVISWTDGKALTVVSGGKTVLASQ
jgi:hypothetical protein